MGVGDWEQFEDVLYVCGPSTLQQGLCLVLKLSSAVDMTVYNPICLPVSGADFQGKDLQIGFYYNNQFSFFLCMPLPLHPAMAVFSFVSALRLFNFKQTEKRGLGL
jgi:hypothetical protein